MFHDSPRGYYSLTRTELFRRWPETRPGRPQSRAACCPVLSSDPMGIHVLDHPLLHETMARLRDRDTPCDDFRMLAYRISLLLTLEGTRDLPSVEGTVETPLETAAVRRLSARGGAVPGLRAGLGVLGAFLDLVPSAQVGYFGLERDEATAVARSYS